jgi:hypothetical protein
MNNQDVIKLVQQTVQDEMKKAQGFRDWDRKDTPTDSYSVVNRNYTNLNGTVASRPIGSVATIGQRYFATDTGIPMVRTSTNWVNGVGSVVAIN